MVAGFPEVHFRVPYRLLEEGCLGTEPGTLELSCDVPIVCQRQQQNDCGFSVCLFVFLRGVKHNSSGAVHYPCAVSLFLCPLCCSGFAAVPKAYVT